MTVTVILNGDIETCCSYILAEDVEPTVRAWMPPGHDLEMVNRETTEWEPDEIAGVAVRWFGREAYPLVYIDETLCTFGALPSKKNLSAYLNGEREFGVTAEDIVNAGKAMNYTPAEGSD
ncbi:MAG: hypothetical protein PF508_04895 [Spirochaeta sp.]|jgi:hypothetical protein|nr:hypothetical protein [Spirochaeta sp.]